MDKCESTLTLNYNTGANVPLWTELMLFFSLPTRITSVNRLCYGEILNVATSNTWKQYVWLSFFSKGLLKVKRWYVIYTVISSIQVESVS